MDSSLTEQTECHEELASNVKNSTEDQSAPVHSREAGDHNMPRYLSPTNAAMKKTKPKYAPNSPKMFKFGKPVEEPKKIASASPLTKPKMKVSESNSPGYMQLTSASREKTKRRREGDEVKSPPVEKSGIGDELPVANQKPTTKQLQGTKSERRRKPEARPQSKDANIPRYLAFTSAAKIKTRNKNELDEASPKMKFGTGAKKIEKIPFLNIADAPVAQNKKTHQKGGSTDKNMPRYLSMTSAAQVKTRVKAGDVETPPKMHYGLNSVSQDRTPTKSPLKHSSESKQDIKDHSSTSLAVIEQLLESREAINDDKDKKTLLETNISESLPSLRRVGVMSSSPPKEKGMGCTDSSIPRYLSLTSAAKVKARHKLEVTPEPKMRFGISELSVSPTCKISQHCTDDAHKSTDQEATDVRELNDVVTDISSRSGVKRRRGGSNESPTKNTKEAKSDQSDFINGFNSKAASDLTLRSHDSSERRNEKIKGRQTNSTNASPMKRNKNSPKQSVSDTNTSSHSASKRPAEKVQRKPIKRNEKKKIATVPFKYRECCKDLNSEIPKSEVEVDEPQHDPIELTDGVEEVPVEDPVEAQDIPIRDVTPPKQSMLQGLKNLWISKYHIDKDPKWVDAIELRMCDINDDGSLKLPLSDIDEVSQLYNEYEEDRNLGVKTGVNFALTAGMLYLGYQIGLPQIKW